MRLTGLIILILSLQASAQDNWYLGSTVNLGTFNQSVTLRFNQCKVVDTLVRISPVYYTPKKTVLLNSELSNTEYGSVHNRTSGNIGDMGFQNLQGGGLSDTNYFSNYEVLYNTYCAKIDNPSNDTSYRLISLDSKTYKTSHTYNSIVNNIRIDSISYGNNLKNINIKRYDAGIDSIIAYNSSIGMSFINSGLEEFHPFKTFHEMLDWRYDCHPNNFNLLMSNGAAIYAFIFHNSNNALVKVDSIAINTDFKYSQTVGGINYRKYYSNREIIKLKLSYDGKRFGFINFDSSTSHISYYAGQLSGTGQISNVQKLDSFRIDLPAYEFFGKLGFEFSADNAQLLVSVLRKNTSRPRRVGGRFIENNLPLRDTIYAYNLATGNRTLVLATDEYGVSDLQMGPDGHIYGFGCESEHDSTVSQAKQYKYHNIRLIQNSGKWTVQKHCFPNIKHLDYYINESVSFSSPSIHQPYNKVAGLKYEYCLGDTVTAYYTNDCIDSLKMHIIRNGIVLHTNTQDTLNYTLTQSGEYQLATVMHNQWGAFTDTNYFTVKQKDTFNLPTDTSMCQGDTLVLHVNQLANIQYWGDYSQDTNYQITDTGTYSIQALHACGLVFDTVQVSFDPVPKLTSNYIKDTVLCADTLHLRTQSNFAWNNGSKDSLRIIDTTGSYQIISSNSCGADTVELNLTLHDTLALSLGLDTAMCWGKLFYKYLPKDLAKYTWFDASSKDSYQFFAPGTYWVKAENTCGTWYDTLSIDTLHPANINLGRDTATCSQLPLTLNAGAKDNMQTNLSWFWPHNGSRDSSLVVNASGTFTVEVTDQCGTQTHSITVYQLNAPNLQLKDTSICKGDSVRLTANVDSAQIRWSTGDTVAAVWIKDFKTYGVGAVNRCGSDSVKFKVAELLPPKFELPTDTILCNNTSWNVELTQPQSTYLWGNGQTDSKMQINQEGSYAVTITNACGIDNGAVQVKYLNTPVATVSLSLNGKYCPGSPLTLSGSSINKDDTYFWNTVDSSQSILVKKAGTYTLIVSNFCGGDTTTVTPNYYPIKAAFALNQAEHDSPFELEATNQSEGAVDYVWLLDSNKVASTLNLRQRIIAYGKHSISLIASDEFGCSDTALDTVQVFRNRNIPPLLCDFRVDPNPAKDYFIISASNNDKQVRQVKIFNDIGQAIISTDVSHWKENPFYFEYRLNNLPSGTYLIGLYCEDETKYRRVVIAR